MPTFSKRHWLADQLRRWGLLRLQETFRGRPGLLVVNYHRIGALDGHLLEDGLVSATPEDFRAQVAYLRQHFDLPDLETVLRTAEAGFRFTRPTALITFDDGYRDNFLEALPILRELSAPAVFFICPRFVMSGSLPRWDRIAYVFKTTKALSFALDYPFPYRVDLEATTRPLASERFLVALGAWMERFDEETLFAHLEERAGVEVPLADLLRGLFMNWDEVRQLRAAGMSIGSHTLTHPVLAFLPEEEQRHELVQARAVLQRELNCSIETIAYPFGSPHVYTEITKRVARESGYRLAFSYSGGNNRSGHPDLFDVRRIPIDSDVTSALFRARIGAYRAFGRPLF